LHHDMAGALSAFVTAMDFTWRVLVVLAGHEALVQADEDSGRPSYSFPLGSHSPMGSFTIGSGITLRPGPVRGLRPISACQPGTLVSLRRSSARST
jgi:hypothetical protein